MTVTFHTVVLDVPASPLGLLARKFVVQHRCNLCRGMVATAELVVHAQDHGEDR